VKKIKNRLRHRILLVNQLDGELDTDTGNLPDAVRALP
jgi:hypothetical protein